MDWFLYDRDFYLERVNPFIHNVKVCFAIFQHYKWKMYSVCTVFEVRLFYCGYKFLTDINFHKVSAKKKKKKKYVQSRKICSKFTVKNLRRPERVSLLVMCSRFRICFSFVFNLVFALYWISAEVYLMFDCLFC